MKTAVVCPHDKTSLVAALQASQYMEPVLIGNADLINRAAIEADVSLNGLEYCPVKDDQAAAKAAVRLAKEHRVQAITKGHIHTDDLLRPIVARDGLRTDRRLSHVFALTLATGRELFVTDAAINVAPDLPAKRDIIQNAIDMVRALGHEEPKVALLSATETPTDAMPSSKDASVLKAMALGGKITGGLVEGPLALDNAISMAAAKAKGIDSPVAGQADILVVPNIEAGNILAKAMVFISGAQAAGLVMGAQVPIMLTSRADSINARVMSARMAMQVVKGG